MQPAEYHDQHQIDAGDADEGEHLLVGEMCIRDSYNCVGVLNCNIIEKQRVAVDQYLMRVNRDLLYERGKFVTAYERNEILFSMSDLNPEDVISDLLMVLSWFEKFKVGFLAVSGGILSVDRASKLESDTPLFLGKEKYNKCLEALRTPIAIL